MAEWYEEPQRRLLHDEFEQILVGYLIGDDCYSADRVMESGIEGAWFHNKELGETFDQLWDCYYGNNELIHQPLASCDPICDACYKLRLETQSRFDVNAVIRLLTWRHKRKIIDQRYEQFIKLYDNPDVGPEKAINKFMEAMSELSSEKGVYEKA